MSLLIDRFADNDVLAACATRLESAVVDLEQRIDDLDEGDQTRILKDLTDRFLESLGRAADEAHKLNGRTN